MKNASDRSCRENLKKKHFLQ